MTDKALLIGNSDGIGLGTTKELLKRGWKTVGISKSESSIEDPSYVTFVRLLKEIGVHARTHRISVVTAAILRFALNRLPSACKEGTLGHALLALEEEPYLASKESDEYDIMFDLIDELCCEAGLQNSRKSSKGDSYSIADSAIAEYIAWYNMPWEDY